MQSLTVRRWGRSGPVVLLLHGLGASGRFWRLVAECMADHARVVCPDLLGFGRSPRPAAAYSVADHLLALDELLDGLDSGATPVVLGGHSTGAMLALEWAAARPERFGGVALIALPAHRTAGEARANIGGLSPLAWATVAHPGLGELMCGVMCAGRPFWRALMPVLTPGVPADIARDFVLHDWVSYSGTLRHVVVEHQLAPAARRLADAHVPVWLLHGDRDRAAPLAAARELAGECGWPLAVLPGIRHRLPVDAPGACVDLLRVLLAGAERPAPDAPAG